MTSKVTIEAQSHDCEVRLLPRLSNGEEAWDTLTEGTRKFAQFIVPVGETREFFVHSGQSAMVREAGCPDRENQSTLDAVGASICPNGKAA